MVMLTQSPYTEVSGYSMVERDRRWSLAREFMTEQGLDALLVFGEHEDAGAAAFDFDTWFTNGRAGTVVIFPRDGDPIVLTPMSMFITDHMEGVIRGDITWVPAASMRVGRGSAGIAAVLHEVGLQSSTIGVVGLDPYPPFHGEGIIPFTLWTRVLELVPSADFRPVGPAFGALTMVLSSEEIAVMRHSAAIGDAMAIAMAQAAAPGVSESIVYAAGMSAAFERGAVIPAMHLWSGEKPVAWGPPQWAYRPQAPRVIQDGDIVSGEVFSRFGMRDTQHQVIIAVGDVHEDFERAAAVARASYDAGIKALRPGRRFGDVADAMLAATEGGGGWVMGPQAHGINPFGALCGFPGTIGKLDGADVYPPMADYPTLQADLVLEPGMSFAFEPNYAFGRRKATIGGTVVVGQDEPLELNPLTARILRAGAEGD
jgi:Xaa-Pro aminopeptidase